MAQVDSIAGGEGCNGGVLETSESHRSVGAVVVARSEYPSTQKRVPLNDYDIDWKGLDDLQGCLDGLVPSRK